MLRGFEFRHVLVAVIGAGFLAVASQARAGNDTFTTYGDVGQIAIPVIAGAIALVKEDDAEGLVQLGLTSVVTLGITHGLKVTVDRERPNGGGMSFPSGHTASAFMGASFLHYRYGWEYGVPAYAAAALVGYSRVDADKHFWEDVVAAAVIANVTAYVFTDTLNDDVVIVPFVDLGKKNFGITAAIHF